MPCFADRQTQKFKALLLFLLLGTLSSAPLAKAHLDVSNPRPPRIFQSSCVDLVEDITTTDVATTTNQKNIETNPHQSSEDVAKRIARYLEELQPVLLNPHNPNSAATSRFTSLEHQEFASDLIRFFEKEFRLPNANRDLIANQDTSKAIEVYSTTLEQLNSQIRKFNESQVPPRFWTAQAFGFNFKNGKRPREKEILELEKKTDDAQLKLSNQHKNLEQRIAQNQNLLSQINLWSEKIEHEIDFLRAFEKVVFGDFNKRDDNDPQKAMLQNLLTKITESIEYLEDKAFQLNHVRASFTNLNEANLMTNDLVKEVRSSVRYHFEASQGEPITEATSETTPTADSHRSSQTLPTRAIARSQSQGWIQRVSNMGSRLKHLFARQPKELLLTQEELKVLRDSKNPEDVRKYLKAIQKQVGSWNFEDWFKDSGNDFLWHTKDSLLRRSDLPYDVREQAALEYLWMSRNRLAALEEILASLNETEKKRYTAEIKQWQKSSDERKKQLLAEFYSRWNSSIQFGYLKTLQRLAELELFDVNSKNISGYSTLIRAGHAGQKDVVEWLLENPQLDLSQRDEFGLTDLENLRLSGRKVIANTIEWKRPEISSRHFKAKRLKKDASPSFLKIHPGQFFMGDGVTGNLQKIAKPFELMSKFTDVQTWSEVIELAKEHLGSGLFKVRQGHLVDRNSQGRFGSAQNTLEVIDLTSLDISISKDETASKTWVKKKNFRDISVWLSLLNALSQSGEVKVQQKLAALFLGHTKGAVYRLQTDSEAEFVTRLRGKLDGNYQSLVILHNSVAPHQIDANKLINGQPIFGLLTQDEFVQDHKTGTPMTLNVRVAPHNSLRFTAQSFLSNNAVFRIAREFAEAQSAKDLTQAQGAGEFQEAQSAATLTEVDERP